MTQRKLGLFIYSYPATEGILFVSSVSIITSFLTSRGLILFGGYGSITKQHQLEAMPDTVLANHVGVSHWWGLLKNPTEYTDSPVGSLCPVHSPSSHLEVEIYGYIRL